MPIWEYYKEVKIDPQPEPLIKRRYSVTANVLSFKRCSKQYGFISERKYEPALVVQLYYGTIIHQVLDKAHNHYTIESNRGNDNPFASDHDIEQYFT